MKLEHLGTPILCVGTLLLASSFARNYVIPRDACWTDDQAVALQTIQTEYHNAAFRKKEGAVQGVRQAYESNRWELDRAMAGRDRLSILRSIGLVAGVIGVALILAGRIKKESQYQPKMADVRHRV